MTARMCRDIAEVRSAGALEPSRCFYSSDAWLSMLTEHGHRYQYPLVLKRCGAAAGVPLSAGTSVASRRYRPSVLADGRLDDAQCAVAGPLTGYRTALLRSHDMLAVADAAPDLLACAGVSTVLFPYLDSRDAADFEAAGFPVAFAAWEAWLDVPPGGLGEYQAGLPRAKRQRVAADLRKVRDAGMRFESGPLDGPFDRVSELLAGHERKYDPAYSGPDSGFVRYLGLCANVPGAHLIAAFIGAEMVGAAVMFRYRDVVWMRLIGVDDTRPDTRGCYFSLAYYQPIQLAQRLSARAVHLGTGALPAKVWRGARIEPLWAAAVAGPGPGRHAASAGIASRSVSVLDALPGEFQAAPASPAAGLAERPA